MLCHTFAIAMINVIDAVVSGIGLRKYAHVDGVRWTLAHTRHAAMGGFAVQPPVDTIPKAFGGHQRPISLSPRALLQARQTGSLEKLPDIDITHRWWTSNTWAGRLLVLRVVWFLTQSFIRWRECLSITPLEIIACVFGTYTVMTYIVLDNAIFSYRVSTILSLRDEELFWSKLEDGGNIWLSHDLRTKPGRASYIDDSSPRRRQNYLIDPVLFGVGIVAGCLIFDVLQAMAWDEISPNPIQGTSLIVQALTLTGVSSGVLMTVLFQRTSRRISLSDRTEGVLVKVSLRAVVFLTLIAASPKLASLVFVGVILLFGDR